MLTLREKIFEDERVKMGNFADEQFSDKNFANFDPLFSEKEEKSNSAKISSLKVQYFYLRNSKIPKTDKLSIRSDNYCTKKHFVRFVDV